jgi:hypothetical protein
MRTKSTHAGSWSYRSSPPSRPVSRDHDDADPGFDLVAANRRLYMRTDLRKMDAVLQVIPAATQCGQKIAYCALATPRRRLLRKRFSIAWDRAGFKRFQRGATVRIARSVH